jgi:predicted ATPase/class 3 adenylate cyclase
MSIATSYIQSFLPLGRRRALFSGLVLPENDTGTCLFADISGFTPLTEALGKSLSPQRGAEALTAVINNVFEALIAQVHAYGGDVMGFAGDAITCWFAQDPGDKNRGDKNRGDKNRGVSQDRTPLGSALAALAALAMQREMAQFAAVPTPDGNTHKLSMKIGLAHGPVRRLLVGAPEYGLFEVLAGEPVSRMAAAEHHASTGEIVCAPEVAAAWGGDWWGEPREGYCPLIHAPTELEPPQASPVFFDLPAEAMRPYFPPALFDCIVSGGEALLAELRPAVSAFVRFDGLDYENDPAVRDKLNQYVVMVQQSAARYGGTLIRLDYGDKGSVMHVVFGTPVAHEDDEARAVGWSLELQTSVRELPFITAQKIGMTKGQVYAGPLGAKSRRGYTLMGDEVNASARLMQACQPGQTLVSQAIMQAAQKRYMFHQFPGFQVKGKYEPIPVATPLSPLPPMPQMAPAGPLVGREAELAQITEVLNALMAGQGRVLRIVGSAGVGKSRLAGELVQRAMAAGVRTVSGAAQSVGGETPYLAWRDIFRSLFGLQSAWPAAQQAMQMQTMLQWINPEWIARLPLLGDVLGLDIPDTPVTAAFDARLRQESLFALVGDLLARLAAQQPLLILIEDGHWLDEASAALIDSVGRGLAQARVLLAITHRPPDDPECPLLPGLNELPHAIHMALDELTPEAVRVIVTARLGGELPPDILAMVEERSQGNPFFVEELAETLRETACLHMVDGRWTLAGGVSAPALPGTIQGIVLARLDRLDEGSRLTVKVASVVGQIFEVEAVAHIRPEPETAEVLNEQLDRLAKRDLVHPERLEPQPAQRFKHSVTREVAYGTLLYAQRRPLHRAVAGWYEAAYGGGDRDGDNGPRSAAERDRGLAPYLPLLVHHYHYAEEPGKECHYAALAGKQAAARFANVEALRYLGRALELTPETEQARRYDLLLTRERVHHLQGQREAQSQDLDALQALAESLDSEGGSLRRAEVTLRRADYFEATGDYPAVIAAAQAAIELAGAAGDVAKEAAGYWQWGRALGRQGEYNTAKAQLESTLTRARDAQLRRLEADSLYYIGYICMHHGNYAEARNYYEQAQRIYQDIGDLLSEAKSINAMALLAWRQADHTWAQTYFEQAVRIFRELGDRRDESTVLNNLGMISEEQGDPIEARAFYEQALRICREIGNRLGESHALNNLGLVSMLHQGDYSSAKAYFEQALRLCRELGNQGDESSILSSLCLLFHLVGEDEAAHEHSQQALHIAKKIGDQAIEGEALTHLGHALTGLGRLDEASKVYTAALAIRRELGEQTLAIETLAGLAHVSLAQGKLAEAQTQVKEILAYLETHSLTGAYEPFRIYLTCYHVLRAGQDARAGQVLATAHRLLQERADRIGDEVARRAFLENVAAHRQIVQEMQE